MRRSIISLLLLFCAMFTLSAPAMVSAQEATPFPLDKVCEGDAENSTVCNTTDENPISGKDGVIMNVVNILSFVIGVSSVIMVMIGGLKYITSNGDSNSIAAAKNTILYAIVGVLVFLVSQAIIIFVIGSL